MDPKGCVRKFIFLVKEIMLTCLMYSDNLVI